MAKATLTEIKRNFLIGRDVLICKGVKGAVVSYGDDESPLIISREGERIHCSDPVIVACYGKAEAWAEREAAKAFYLEGMMCSEGSERDRHTNIYLALEAGQMVCSDEM